jgi:hypothetical protein
MEKRGKVTEILRCEPQVLPKFTQTYPNPFINAELKACYVRTSGGQNFPLGHCNSSIDIVTAVLGRFGFQPRYGYFLLDKPDGKKLKKTHTWAEDVDKRFIDLTGFQFNQFLEEHNKLTEGVVIIEPDSPLRTRYQPFMTKPAVLPQ